MGDIGVAHAIDDRFKIFVGKGGRDPAAGKQFAKRRAAMAAGAAPRQDPRWIDDTEHATLAVDDREARVAGSVSSRANSCSVIVAGTVSTATVMTSETRVSANGSTRYSRSRWWPRRAIFSVRIERRMASTVSKCAGTQAAISGSSRCVLPVSSTAKNVAVSGERIVPPIVAHIATSGQKPGLAAGNT